MARAGRPREWTVARARSGHGYGDSDDCTHYVQVCDPDEWEPGTLSGKYAGEFERHTDPRDAAEVALRVLDEWDADLKAAGKPYKLGLTWGSTGGGMVAFDVSEATPEVRAALVAACDKGYESLPKCAQCGDLLGSETWNGPYGDNDDACCSEHCAEKRFAVMDEDDEEF